MVNLKLPQVNTEAEEFNVGDRIVIDSSHSLFPQEDGVITARPSLDAAIVELKSGAREHLRLEYLCPIENLPLLENVGVGELTTEEQNLRLHLERKVERAFYEAGRALRELRDRKLYRSTHRTFEEYCQDRFGYHRRHSYQLIDAAEVVENLCANGAQKSSVTDGAQMLPTSERQVRPLIKLKPAEQVIAWQQAVNSAGGKAPSGRQVKTVVEHLKHKSLVKASDRCWLGAPYTLVRLEASERKYNGCWVIASSINDITVEVEVHDNVLIVKPENLTPIDEPDAHRQLPEILRRIITITQS